VPGELEHASGEVDEFEAALVAGADGQTVDDDADVRDAVDADAVGDEEDVDAGRSAVGDDDLEEGRSAPRHDEDLEADVAADAQQAVDADVAADAFGDEDDLDAGRSAVRDDEDDLDDATLESEAAAAAPRRGAATPGAPTRKGAGRFVGFLRASWAELQRVQWPDRRQVAQATGVVIGFVIVAGLYLGVADWVAKQIVNAII
jgi:preprotein translocase subunit SecE